MGAVLSVRESRSVALVWRLGIVVTGVWFCAYGKPIIASSELQLLWEGYVVFIVCILYNIIIIQYNLIL